MIQYKNLSGNSSVHAYETGPNYILVQFTDGSVYQYDYAAPGTQAVREMNRLAEQGRG